MKRIILFIFLFSLCQFSFKKDDWGPGKDVDLTGWVVKDHFGSFYLFNGCYVCPISKNIKKQFENYVDKPVSVYLLKSCQYMNPGNLRLDSVGEIKIIKTDSIYNDNLDLNVKIGETNAFGKVGISFELKNTGAVTKSIYPFQISFIVNAVKTGKDDFRMSYPDDDTSITIQDCQWNFMYRIKDRMSMDEFSKVESKLFYKGQKLQPNEIFTDKICCKLPDGLYYIWAGYGDTNFSKAPNLKSKNGIEFKIANGKSEIIPQ